ncbi:hypothetical protein [Nocardioides sp. R-C-SC26]|uniref:TolB family protein n=1 Tax=Nocardioides sp. R-C-SC26 TaxID=2870414 RepID=UPI001E339976|nr:hypothetical protein [Nocardioides sp. R-C-SC26]
MGMTIRVFAPSTKRRGKKVAAYVSAPRAYFPRLPRSVRAAFGSDVDLSDNGRFLAFSSDGLDPNGRTDVFRWDRVTGELLAVSAPSTGSPGDGASTQPSISGDGSVIAFSTTSTNLVRDDANGVVADIVTATVSSGDVSHRRVSLTSSGQQLPAQSTSPTLGRSGDTVGFVSGARLDPDDNDSAPDVYVRDTRTGTTDLVSDLLIAGNGANLQPSLSDDEAWMAFTANGPVNPADVNGASDVVRVGLRGQQDARVVSFTPDRGTGTGASHSPSISGDGGIVAFATTAGSLTEQRTGQEIVIWRAATNSLHVVSTPMDGFDADGGSGEPAVSGDGSAIAFVSASSQLVPGDTNGVNDVYLRDLRLNSTSLLSIGVDGATRVGASSGPAISMDGRFVAFSSAARLVPADQDINVDVYLCDRRSIA